MSVRLPVVKRLLRLAQHLAGNNRAATAIEYGLIAALVVIASMVALTQVASTTIDMWNNVNSKVTAAH